jgi:hypothetical protein
MGTVVLRAVNECGYWRVKMMWPEHSSRHFGKFLSRTEAEKWIEEHRWLTAQDGERQKAPDVIPATAKE